MTNFTFFVFEWYFSLTIQYEFDLNIEKIPNKDATQLVSWNKHFNLICFDILDFQTSTAEEFKEHQAKCKPGHPCQVCGVVLASKNGLNNHLKATHMGVRKYQCHMCQYAGKSAQRLREHIMTHTSE